MKDDRLETISNQIRCGIPVDMDEAIEAINYQQNLRDIRASYHWWQKDKDGWPIESIEGRGWFSNFVRTVFQNMRKVTG